MRSVVGFSLRSAGWLLLCLAVSFAPIAAQEPAWRFTDVTNEAGFGFNPDATTSWSGVAAGDYDRDGWVDLLVNQDDLRIKRLYRNMGDGTFRDVTQEVGLVMPETIAISTLLTDLDGNGWLDVYVLAIDDTEPRLFLNEGGMFTESEDRFGITPKRVMFSGASGDYDLDGDVDIYLAMNQDDPSGFSQFWRNNGDGTMSDVTESAGILAFTEEDHEFAPTFADVNNDGWPDLLVVADFNNSQVYLNNGDGTFTNATDEAVITDEGGMGSAVMDYDNDGDLDWFVSSIWDPAQSPLAPWGVSSGNRLYRNKGDGTFEDATESAGVRVGYWGWGSVFGDFNNDGHPDIFHTNGFVDLGAPFFLSDPARFFVNDGNGAFTEQSEVVGLADTGLGHGVACLDYDHDGDLDLFIANSRQSPRLYRNDSVNLNSVNVRLIGDGMNSEALGARVYLNVEGMDFTQMREIHAGTNFLSQDPADAHFGMGSFQKGTIEVVWPITGVRTRLYDVQAGERLVIPQMPVSYNDSSSGFYSYWRRNKMALDGQVAKGTIDKAAAARILESAVKAYVETNFGN